MAGEDDPTFKRSENHHEDEYIEDAADKIHDHLHSIINGQTQYRLVNSCI